MIANLPSAFAAFFLEEVLMGIGTVLGVDRSAAKIPGGIREHSEGSHGGWWRWLEQGAM